MRFRTEYVLPSVLAIVSAICSAQPTGAPPPANVRVATVVERVIEQKRRVTGEVIALRRSELAAEEGGLVIELAVDAGTSVRKGDLIARLDASRVELALVEARAGVPATQAVIAERQAQLAQADLDLSRIRELVALESSSETELDRAVSAAAVAKARVAQARAQLAVSQARVAVIEQRLADLDIHAPFSGQIVAKMTEVGQWVRAGDPVVDLVELAQIEIRVDVPEAFIERASRAETVSVLLPALGREIEARVLAVVPQADPRTRLFPVRLIADNAAGLIRPGMSAIGLVPTTRREKTLLIPKDAVLQGEVGSYVYIDHNGKASIAPIERLFATGNLVAVRSRMLSAGMSIVVEGNERLYPGQTLAILPDEPAPMNETNTPD
jgi:RND family efflux transporter MFP subunit